jgi:hypothetical protein
MVRQNKTAIWAMGVLLLAAMALWAAPALAAAEPKTNYEVVATAKVTKVVYQIKKYNYNI